MKKLAEKAAINMFEKVADEQGRKYRLSRIATGGTDIPSLGLTHAIYGRAAQGRANLGQEGVTKAEDLKLKAVANDGDNRNYPISRALTNPAIPSLVGAAGGLGVASLAGRGRIGKAIQTGAGAAAGYLWNNASRDIYARSDIGKANAGRTGFGKTKQHQLKRLRDDSVDSSERVQSQMDSDTLKKILRAAAATTISQF